jgi:glycerol uptake facilitator-like aquaporin
MRGYWEFQTETGDAFRIVPDKGRYVIYCGTRPLGSYFSEWFTEWLATFALVVTILAGLRFAQASVPWLTASTSFANPSHAH